MVDQLHDGAYSARRGALKAPEWLSRAAKTALGFVYPSLCPVCRTETAATGGSHGGGLCGECWGGVRFISGVACDICGAPVQLDAADIVTGGGVTGGGDEPKRRAICDGCAHAPPAWSRGAAATVYDGAARKLILMFKHGDRLDIAPLAARWMARAGASLIEEADLIAPAPLHWRRMVKRRYNQAGELAREIAVTAGRPEAGVLDLLQRVRSTDSMDGKNRRQRLDIVRDAFIPSAPEAMRGKRILLVDDVLTTGATLSACAEACRAAGAADVNVLVLARVARGDWPT